MHNDKKEPVHITEAYGLTIDEKDLDFFDVNLEYDSRLFIDPFLIKKSPVEEERFLFERFGDFFRYAYDKSLLIKDDEQEYLNLKNLLNFHEPKELGLGYTENSHDGAGPGPSFANILFQFFVGNSARRLIKEEGLFPDGKFNPITLRIFIDDIGPDSLSDITANIIMDYLINYTQDQCRLLNIPLKRLPVEYDGFDFEEMEWKGGGYYDLPENLSHPGTAVIFVPKRLLRASELENDNIETKVKGILQRDTELARRFSLFLSKKVSDISITDIRGVFLEEGSVFKKYLEMLTEERTGSYNFEKDILKILAIKSYSKLVKIKDVKDITSCDELLNKTLEFIQLYKDHLSVADGWKDAWQEDNGKLSPAKEVVIGRIFRGMGLAYFHHFPTVTFESEVGTGNGPVDFKVILGSCRIVIELKKLENSSPKGEPPMPSYLHGIKRQLPDYAYLSKASNAIYITGQHYTKRNRPKNSHDERREAIEALVSEVETELKTKIKGFESLHYINIDLSPRESASNL